MKMVSVVGDGERKTVRAPEELLESCWTLADQEMMLDVAAIMAATQPEIAAALTIPAGAPPALALHCSARELKIKRAS